MAADPLKAPRGGGEFGVEVEASEVPAWFLNYLQGALKLPLFSVPKPFESWMIDKVASSGFQVPISQVLGFAQFTVQVAATIATTETTTSTSYTDLATVGPSLSGLPDGSYLVMHGCEAKDSAGGVGAIMSYSVNGAAASAANLCENANTQFCSVFRATTVTLDAGGNNSIVAKYRVGGASTGSFASRSLMALRYANT